MNVLPAALESAMEALGALPGVGPRSAERYAYFLLRSNPANSHKIADSLQNLHNKISYCPKTFALIDKKEKFSPLYTSPKRDKTTVAVVEDPFDILAIEKTGQYSGTYHVLGGLISPIDGIGPEQLNVGTLLKRIKEDNVKEIILATNASVEGESTSLYLSNELRPTGIKITRLAQGLPIGLDLEYADQITLGRALEGRRAL